MEVTLQMSESARLREALDRAKSRALAWTPTYGLEPTWQIGAAAVIAIYENALHEAGCDGCAVKADPVTELHLNKITHRLRFADEDEFSARVIIEPK